MPGDAEVVAPDGMIPMPLDTYWMAWVTLATVVWLLVTHNLREQVKKTLRLHKSGPPDLRITGYASFFCEGVSKGFKDT